MPAQDGACVLGIGAAMVIETLILCFHLTCFHRRGHDQVKVQSEELQYLEVVFWYTLRVRVTVVL